MANGAERLDTYIERRSWFEQTEGQNEQLVIAVENRQAQWLRTSRDVGINPSTLVSHALWLTGLRRLAGSYGLQAVIKSEGDPVAVELPGWQDMPDEDATEIQFEVPAKTAALQDWVDETFLDVYPEDALFNGVRMLTLATQLTSPKFMVGIRVSGQDGFMDESHTFEESIQWHPEMLGMPRFAE